MCVVAVAPLTDDLVVERRVSDPRSIDPRMKVRLFGPLRVDIAGRTLGPRDFGGVKPKQLLEILLLSRGHPVPKERLGELLWAGSPPKSVNATLETYVSVVRNRLDPTGTLGREIVRTEHGAYSIGRDVVWVDLDEFDKLVSAPVDSEADEARRLSQAVELVGGELLEDEPYAGWVERDRDRYRFAHRDALIALAEARLRGHDFAGALRPAMEGFEDDATDERACRAAMLACYGVGRQELSLRAFLRLRTALRRELQVDPMTETESLFTAIRRKVDPKGLVIGLLSWVAGMAMEGGEFLTGEGGSVLALIP
jgi:DNA-binding SARP family transcriptional activator